MPKAPYLKVIVELKVALILPEVVELRQVKYLNNLVERACRFMRRLAKPGMSFFSFDTVWRTLQGYARDAHDQERANT